MIRRALAAAAIVGPLSLAACDVSGRGPSDHPPPAIMPSDSERSQEAEVRAMVEAKYPNARVTWRKLTIDGARQVLPEQARAARLRPFAIAWPVYANLTTISGAGARDIRWGYYLFKSDSGQWILVSDGTPFNHDDPHQEK